MSNHLFVDQAMDFGDRLLQLAEEGDRQCDQDSCLVLLGVVRDCGYKIRSEASRCRQGLDAMDSSKCPTTGGANGMARKISSREGSTQR